MSCLQGSHLVLDARLEVSHEGDGFVVLDLPELDRLAAQEVIQLGGKDGRRTTLVLGTIVSCGERRGEERWRREQGGEGEGGRWRREGGRGEEEVGGREGGGERIKTHYNFLTEISHQPAGTKMGVPRTNSLS